jgi:hypothetical protein
LCGRLAVTWPKVRLAPGMPKGEDPAVEPVFDERDVSAILNALFDMKVNLDRIAAEVRVIRLVIQDDDDEEEELEA